MGRNLIQNVEDLWDEYEADYLADGFPDYTSSDVRAKFYQVISELEAPKAVRDINARIIRVDNNDLQVVHCGNCHYEGAVVGMNIKHAIVRNKEVHIGSSKCKGCNKTMHFIRRVIDE